MKFSEIKNLNPVDLRKKLEQIKQEFFSARMNLSMQRLPNPLLLRTLRKDKARIETALSQFKNKDRQK